MGCDWRIRKFDAEDAEALTALTMQSKAWWGYDEAFMRDAAEELRFRPELFPDGWVYLLENGGELAAFCSLRRQTSAVVELHDLFVHPAWMRKGCGRALWNHALEVARENGFAHVVLNADPHAEDFYLRMGARRIGKVPSAIRPGRTLPVMHFALRGDALPESHELPGESAC